MKRGTFLSLLLAGAASLALLAPASALADAGKLDTAGCLSCHDSSKKKIELPGKDDEKRTLAHINAGKFGKGIHGEMQCVACHKEITDSKANHAKTSRLKALRLAKEEEDAQAQKNAPASKPADKRSRKINIS